ncbi:MAG TPA: ABC transporter permease subunit [Myxococcaceae bacterium]|nr:ABC transporter permease subunit [Myxococcaceae bacterium]
MRTLTDTLIVFGAELRRALRSPRVLLVLFLYLLFACVTMLGAGFLAQKFQAQAIAQGQSPEALLSPKAGFLAAFFRSDRVLIESLIDIPASVLVVFVLGRFFLSAYVALLGFDSVSAELQTRSLRYLGIRTSRTALALGKGLALAAVVVVLVTLVHLGAFGYALATVSEFSLGDAARAWPRLWGTTVLIGVAMAALTTFCSTLSRSPALALTLNLAVLFGLWVVSVVSDAARLMRTLPNGGGDPSLQERLGLLVPATWSTEALYPDPGRALPAALVLLGFAVLYMAGAAAVLRSRDL